VKRRPVKEHRADDDPRRRLGAAAGEQPWPGLSSAGVSRRRSLTVSQPDAKRSVEHSGSEQQNSAELPEVEEAREAYEADACGALGCRRGEPLLKIVVDGRTRVLCRDHARRWTSDE